MKTLLRIFIIGSWIADQLDPRVKEKPSLSDLRKHLKDPGEGHFS